MLSSRGADTVQDLEGQEAVGLLLARPKNIGRSAGSELLLNIKAGDLGNLSAAGSTELAHLVHVPTEHVDQQGVDALARLNVGQDAFGLLAAQAAAVDQ